MQQQQQQQRKAQSQPRDPLHPHSHSHILPLPLSNIAQTAHFVIGVVASAIAASASTITSTSTVAPPAVTSTPVAAAVSIAAIVNLFSISLVRREVGRNGTILEKVYGKEGLVVRSKSISTRRVVDDGGQAELVATR